jgi:hypothetical protein
MTSCDEAIERVAAVLSAEPRARTAGCLFARSPDEETEIVTRARMRWWDWLPVRERQWQTSGERLEDRLGPSS